jgi:hypothetical protein
MKIGSLEDQKSPKNAKMGIFEPQGDTYAVVGRPSNLVTSCFHKLDVVLNKTRLFGHPTTTSPCRTKIPIFAFLGDF